MKRLCLDCPNTIDTTEGSRCKRCRAKRERQRGTRDERNVGTQHKRIRKQVLAEESVCWMCGLPALPGDPLTADHIIPRAAGGRTVRENYRAAHRSCNSRRGATQSP
jgi:5-methylcytosine-specific restriction endonuclease McrA